MSEITFLTKLTAIPRQTTSIYKLKSPLVSEAKITEIARGFKLKGNLKGAELTKDVDVMTYVEGPFVINLNRNSGALRFYDATRWQLDDGKSHVQLNDQQAVELADKFIKDTKLIPLNESKLMKVTRLYAGSVEKGGGNHDERIIDIGVIYQRMIGGIPVDGPGGKAIIYLDHKGEVTGCDRTWRQFHSEYRKIPFADIRPPEFAEQNLKLFWQRYNIKQIEVRETRFAYFELGPNEKQQYLQPAYIMPLKLVFSEEKLAMKTFHVVYASSKPVGAAMTHKIFPAEPLRKE